MMMMNEFYVTSVEGGSYEGGSMVRGGLPAQHMAAPSHV